MNMEASNIAFPMSNSAQATSSIPSAEASLPVTSPLSTEASLPVTSPLSTEASLPVTSPLSTEASAPAHHTSPPPSSSRPDHVMHKNNLQEYTQKSNLPLPVYQTVNEGLSHALQFRSTVLIDGKSYTTPNFFPSRKAAEQEVAKLALETISKNIKTEVPPLIPEKTVIYKTMFCKCILHEYACKMNLGKITYETVQREELPVFVSTLVLHGKRYTGEAKSKREAEQLAARAAILSNLDNSPSGICLTEIIKSKVKFCSAAAIKSVKDSQYSNTVSPIANTGHAPVSAAPVAANNNEMQVVLPECSSRVPSPRQEFQMPKQEISSEDSRPSDVSLQAGAQQHVDAGSSLKKRKKNKKKANKKSRLDTLTPVGTFPLNEVLPPSAALPLNEAPPCSVAQ